MTNWHLCNYFAPGGLLGVPAVSAITVPTATPAPTMAPTLSTIVRTRRCLAGAIATPAGWAIEYLRELGGFLAIELDDFAHAIRQGDVEWVRRFLRRFPALRAACDTQGKPFQLLAQKSGNQKIAELFG